MKISSVARIIGGPPTDGVITLVEVTPVPAASLNVGDTIEYTFSSTEAGVLFITGAGGNAVAEPTSVVVGNNTITFAPLDPGTYNDITLTVVGKPINDQGAGTWWYVTSNTLAVTSFDIILPYPPEIAEDCSYWTNLGVACPNGQYTPGSMEFNAAGELVVWRNIGSGRALPPEDYDITASVTLSKDQTHGIGAIALTQQAFLSINVNDNAAILQLANTMGIDRQGMVAVVFHPVDTDGGFILRNNPLNGSNYLNKHNIYRKAQNATEFIIDRSGKLGDFSLYFADPDGPYIVPAPSQPYGSQRDFTAASSVVNELEWIIMRTPFEAPAQTEVTIGSTGTIDQKKNGYTGKYTDSFGNITYAWGRFDFGASNSPISAFGYADSTPPHPPRTANNTLKGNWFEILIFQDKTVATRDALINYLNTKYGT